MKKVPTLFFIFVLLPECQNYWLTAVHNHKHTPEQFFLATTSTCVYFNDTMASFLCPQSSTYVYYVSTSFQATRPIFGSENFFMMKFVHAIDKVYLLSASCIAQMQYPFKSILPYLGTTCKSTTIHPFTSFSIAPDLFLPLQNFFFLVQNHSLLQIAYQGKVFYSSPFPNHTNISHLSSSSVMMDKDVQSFILLAFYSQLDKKSLYCTTFHMNHKNILDFKEQNKTSTFHIDPSAFFIDSQQEEVSFVYVSTLSPQHIIFWIVSNDLNVYQIHTPVHQISSTMRPYFPWNEWGASVFQYKYMLQKVAFSELFWIPDTGMHTILLGNLSLLKITSHDLTFEKYYMNYAELSQTCQFKNHPANTFNPCEKGEIFITLNVSLARITNQTFFCIKSPVGGYSMYSVFQNCPLGTVNIRENSISIQACQKCPSLLFAASSTQCLPCLPQEPFQSFLGTTCLPSCPSHQYGNPTTRKCESCPDGFQYSSFFQRCVSCPENTYSTQGMQCLSCPPSSFAAEASSFCSQTCNSVDGFCSANGRMQCAKYRNMALSETSNLDWTEYTFLNLETMLDHWSPTSMIIFDNSSFLIANQDSTLLGIDNSYMLQQDQINENYISLFWSRTKFSDFTFTDYNIQSITSTSLCPSHEWFFFLSDATKGIILQITNWNATYPYNSITYTMINQSMAPAHLCCTTQGLFYWDSNSLSIYFISNYASLSPASMLKGPWTSNWTVHAMIADSDSKNLWVSWLLFAGGALNVAKIPIRSIMNQTEIALNIRVEVQDLVNITKVQIFLRQDKESMYLFVNVHLLLIYYNIPQNTSMFPISCSHSFVLLKTFHGSTFSLAYTVPSKSFYDEELFFRLTKHSINMIHKRAVCECDENFYSVGKELVSCIPCPQGQYSMKGARSCTLCPTGFYKQNTGQCLPCPPFLWSDNAMYGPCRKINSVSHYEELASSPFQLLIDLQRNAQFSWKRSQPLDPSDIVSTSSVFYSFMKHKADVYTVLPDSDQMGFFWNFQLSQLYPTNAHFNYPGLWFQCSPKVHFSQPCLCQYQALSLGHRFIQGELNFWEQQRLRHAISNPENFTFQTLFAVRIHTDTNVPVFIKNASEAPYYVELVSRSQTTDTGTCMLGWPATYECKDPAYFFNIQNGYRCERCPEGKFALHKNDLNCYVPTKQGPICPPATYRFFTTSNTLFNWECRFCPSNTFSSKFMSSDCVPKQMKCPPRHFVLQTFASQDNECKKCQDCPSNTFMFPFFAQHPCDGTTLTQPYECVNQSFSAAGMYLDFSQNRLQYLQCPASRTFDPWQWTRGVFPQLCYFQCKYSIHPQFAFEYFQLFQAQFSDFRYWPVYNQSLNNFPFFAKDNQAWITMVCQQCDLSSCPHFLDPVTNFSIAMQRPLFATGCGAPCLLVPEQCLDGTTHGCIPYCNLPHNSIFIGYGNRSSENQCLWRCKNGFFKHFTSCLSCENVQAMCPDLSVYVGISKCYHYSTLSELCTPCLNNSNGTVLLKDVSIQQKTCMYQCENEGVDYYLNLNPYTQKKNPCIRCPTPQRCPPGFRFQCNPNPCTPCPRVPLHLRNKVSFLASNSTQCMVVCKYLHHTIPLSVPTDVPLPPKLDVGYRPQDIQCVSCQDSMEDCQSLVNCEPGYAINVEGTACYPCKNSLQMNCYPGYYASPCDSGGRVPQTFCVACQTYDKLFSPNDLVWNYWPARLFLPNTLHALFRSLENKASTYGLHNITTLNCPTACIANSIFMNGSCISCSILYPALSIPSKFPYSRFYAVWNASAATRWWDSEFDPPHLGPRYYNPRTNQLLPESRINTCWPCPKNDMSPSFMPPESDQSFLCMNEIQESKVQQAGPSQLIVSDTIFVYNASEPVVSFLSPMRNPFSQIFQVVRIPISTRRRRLLAVFVENYVPIVELSLTLKVEKGIGAPEKPQFYQTQPSTRCSHGYYSLFLWSKICIPCPKGYHCNGISKFSCPQRTTTIHTMSSSIDNCVSSFQPPKCIHGYNPFLTESSAFCNPCPPGSFGMEGSSCTWCPQYAVSSIASLQCQCLPNTVAHYNAKGILVSCMPNPTNFSCTSSYQKHYFTSYYSCHHMDPTYPCHSTKLFYNDLSKRCECVPGTFYSVHENICKQCPRGYYSASYGNAPCVPCVDGYTTPFMGSTSMQECHPI